ncbi:MAG: phosphoenolpyruvate carboxylase, partial [Candidatus Kariarchaeaceae archaeon]
TLDKIPNERKIDHLVNELNNSRPLGVRSFLHTCKHDTKELFETLSVARESIELFSEDAIEAYVISMTKDEIDILSLMLLLKESDLITIENNVVNRACIDIVPLFETKEDLQNASEVMERLFAMKLYRSYIEARNNVQEIMIGYSDSTKDVGYLQSNFRLLNVQQQLIEVAAKFNIRLRIFHGRGGSISRGGGPTHKAILSQLPGTLAKMKITEQGEVIGWNYANPAIAYRHLEQIISALIFRTVVDFKTPIIENSAYPKDEFVLQFQNLADKASEIYESMVKHNPDFIEYYLQFSPLDIIERATIGSRPSRRTSADVKEIDSLRAIPWIFSWMQTRLLFPGYFGVGTALEWFTNNHGIEVLQKMYNEWPYFNSIVNNLQMVCLKADMHIAENYLDLVSTNKDRAAEIFEIIKSEYHKTKNSLLQITQSENLLGNSPDIRNSIMRRNPYIDPLNLIQVELLKQWRKLGKPEDLDPQGVQRALLLTLNGIASGLRNTG